MILRNLCVKNATIVLENLSDRVLDSELTDCIIVARVDMFFTINKIFHKEVINQKGYKDKDHLTKKPHALVKGCVLVNCKLPEAHYEGNMMKYEADD